MHFFFSRNLSSCQLMDDCKSECCLYCVICTKKMCRMCFDKHSCKQNTPIPVVFDERLGIFHRICIDHNTIASYICFDCDNNFVCIYCINREHKTHQFDSVANQALSIRNVLSVELNKLRKDTPSIDIVYELEVKKLQSVSQR